MDESHACLLCPHPSLLPSLFQACPLLSTFFCRCITLMFYAIQSLPIDVNVLSMISSHQTSKCYWSVNVVRLWLYEVWRVLYYFSFWFHVAILNQISAPFIIPSYPHDGGSAACCTVIAQLVTALNVSPATVLLSTVKWRHLSRLQWSSNPSL